MVAMQRQPGEPYRVPRRFGVGTALVVITLFAVLCAGVKWIGAAPELLVFYCSFVVLVSGAQMTLEKSPRLASVMAGAVFFPLSAWGGSLLQGGLDNRLLRQAVDNQDFFWLVVMGGLLGYVGGVLLASLFMLLETLHRWSRPRHSAKTNLTSGVS